jgi:SAM-dependent MidA family methyltransferase
MKKAHESSSLPAPEPIAAAHSAALLQRIGAAIAQAGGWLGFDRYMTLALYEPGLGYYSGGSIKFGRRPEDGSDFITAPELSGLFAQALAEAVAEALGASNSTEVMEFGAGTGRLAAGLLAELETLGVTCSQYTIVELSGELRQRQRAALEAEVPHLAAKVTWIDALPKRFTGVVIGNEVLDAMPVRLVARRDGFWYERGVVVLEDRLVFQDRPLNDATIATDLAQLGEIDESLGAEGYEAMLAAADHTYVTEIHDAACGFVATVCEMLERGVALFIDYGFPRHEYYHPQRSTGTLMCHYRHRAHTDPLILPGLQDITSHVDFSAIAAAASGADAELLGFTSQARFLLNCGITEALARLDPQDTRHFLPAANALQKLLSESEMGELFKVIGFGRGIETPLASFARGDRSGSL